MLISLWKFVHPSLHSIDNSHVSALWFKKSNRLNITKMLQNVPCTLDDLSWNVAKHPQYCCWQTNQQRSDDYKIKYTFQRSSHENLLAEDTQPHILKQDNYINPGSQIPQVEARKRCSCDLFTSSGRATALIDRHFWYTFLQQSMTRLTNTAIIVAYTSHFHWRFSGNWQEHICERNIRCVWSPGHLSLGSDRLNVTVCRTCTVPLWDAYYSGQSEAEVTGKISLDGWRYVNQVPDIVSPPSYSV